MGESCTAAMLVECLQLFRHGRENSQQAERQSQA
jgi:hypothetical protein